MEISLKRPNTTGFHLAQLCCELCHGHGYEQTEGRKVECSACNPDGETLREHITTEHDLPAGDNQAPEK
jgi:DnaJ-class molecular chaperone